MKNMLVAIIAVSSFFVISCKKNNVPDAASETLPTGTVISSGTFTSNAHPSSGTVKVVKDAANNTFLVFENFKTDNGPDVHVWLSPNTTGTTYQEVGLLKAVSGSFSYALGSSFNYTTNNRVLLWCKSFSVLFGNAVLQ
jgi:Electron transfer DM13